MDRKRAVTLVLGVGTAAALTGTLYATLSAVETVGVVAVAAVLLSLYQLRRSARHALVYDRRSAPRRDDVTARERARPGT
jgi:hypothetical protein